MTVAPSPRGRALLPRRRADRRARARPRGVLRATTVSRSTSITSCIGRRTRVVHGQRCLRVAGRRSLGSLESPLADGRGAAGRAVDGAPAGRRGLARDGARASPRSSRRSGCSTSATGAIYGVVLLWPAVDRGDPDRQRVAARSRSLVAVMWRYRDRAAIAGVALGYAIAVKLFLWPLAVWLALVGRRRAAAIARCDRRGVAPPPAPVHEHRRLRPAPAEPRADVRARRVHAVRAAHRPRRAGRGRAGDHRRHSGSRVLALAWRRRSLGLAIAAALVLSPIVWRHFFTLLIVPLALSRPRFDAAWLVPIGLWVGDGTFNGAPWQTAAVLGLVTADVRPVRAQSRAEGVGRLTPAPRHAEA